MEALHHLIYQSWAIRGLAAADFSRLREQTQCFNQRAGITGILWYDGRRFLQILEGPAPVVRDLFARVWADCRHVGVQVLANGAIAHRQFRGWDTTFIRPPGSPSALERIGEPTPETLADTTLVLLLQDFQCTAPTNSMACQS